MEKRSRISVSLLELVLALVVVGVGADIALVCLGGRNPRPAAAGAAQPGRQRGGTSRVEVAPPDAAAGAAAAESSESDADDELDPDAEGPAGADAADHSNPLRFTLTAEARQSIVERFSSALTAGKPDWGVLDRLIKSIEPDEFAPALQFIMELPWSQERDKAMRSLMAQMAAADPAAALELANALPSARQRQAAIDAVTEAWAASDPEAAFAMLLAGKTPDGAAVGLNPGILFAAMYRRDPAWAAGSLAALGDDRTREQAVRGMLVDPENPAGTRRALLDFFGTVEDPRVAGATAQVLVQEWGRVAPSEAAAWVATIQDASARPAAIGALARVWSRFAPEEAITWLAGLDDAALAARSAGEVVGHWQRDNPTGVGVWLREAGPSAVRDSVAVSYVEVTRWQAPAAAFETASTIADAETRVRTMSKAASSWARRDLPAATVAVLQSDLPDSIKRRYAAKAIKPQ